MKLKFLLGEKKAYFFDGLCCVPLVSGCYALNFYCSVLFSSSRRGLKPSVFWLELTHYSDLLVVWSFHVIPRKPRSSIRRGDCLSFHMCYVLVVTKRVLTLSGKAFWLMLELTDLLLNFRTPYLSAYIENFFFFLNLGLWQEEIHRTVCHTGRKQSILWIQVC